jgi:hypothetical protein
VRDGLPHAIMLQLMPEAEALAQAVDADRRIRQSLNRPTHEKRLNEPGSARSKSIQTSSRGDSHNSASSIGSHPEGVHQTIVSGRQRMGRRHSFHGNQCTMDDGMRTRVLVNYPRTDALAFQCCAGLRNSLHEGLELL